MTEQQPLAAGPFDSLACPRCHAAPGTPCIWTSGPVSLAHSARGLAFIRDADEKHPTVRTHDAQQRGGDGVTKAREGNS